MLPPQSSVPEQVSQVRLRETTPNKVMVPDKPGRLTPMQPVLGDSPASVASRDWQLRGASAAPALFSLSHWPPGPGGQCESENGG